MNFESQNFQNLRFEFQCQLTVSVLSYVHQFCSYSDDERIGKHLAASSARCQMIAQRKSES